MSRIELTLAGVGGQGSILAGVILGTAAVSFDHKYAVQTAAYSSELRGGFAAAWVVVDEVPVLYPRVTQPDILLAQAQDSIDRFAATLKPGGALIYDSDLVSSVPASIQNPLGLPATSQARQLFGAPMVANMIMLGALCQRFGVVGAQALKQAIAGAVPKGKEGPNLQAFDLGMSLADR